MYIWMYFCYSLILSISILYQHVFDFQDVFFFYDNFWFAVTLLQQAASKGAAPKAKAKAKAVAQKPQERGRGLDAAIPKRDVCWLCLVVFVAWIFCVFFCVVKLFDLEFLKTQLDESSCWGVFFWSTLGWIRDSMLVETFCGYFHETTSPKCFIAYLPVSNKQCR